MENHTFSHSIDKTFVNGNLVYSDGKICSDEKGMRVSFQA
jgi:dihydroorotase